MNDDYKEHLAIDRRLLILRLLVEAEGYANESSLHYGVTHGGHRRCTREQLRLDLTWLEEHHLLTKEFLNDVVLVAKLTSRGLNVAQGNETVDGVKKPSIV